MGAVTLNSLMRKWEEVYSKRTVQEQVVTDLEAPKRELEALRAEEQRIAAEIEETKARAEQWKAELFDARRGIARRGPREAKITGAIEVLDQLADDAMAGLSQHIDPQLLNRALTQCRAELELLANERATEARLVKSLNDLGVKP